MNNPRLLLLDEVSLGLAPAVVKSLYAVIPIIREAGTTVLLVEQDVNQALAASDMAYCVLEGRVSLSGRAIRALPRCHQRRLLRIPRSSVMNWINAAIAGVLLGGLYALYATGLSVSFGVMRLINLAHGDLAVTAAFLSSTLVLTFGGSPFWTILVLMPVGFGVGVLLQKVVFDRLVGVDPAFQIVATFGLSIVIQNALLQVYTARPSRVWTSVPLKTKASISVGDVSIGVFPLLRFVVAVLVLVSLSLFLGRTSTGRAFRATSDDPEAARLMGIDSRAIYADRHRASPSARSASPACSAVPRPTSPAPTGRGLLIFAFEAVIIGGLGSLWGTLAGGIALGLAQTLGAEQFTDWPAQLFGHLRVPRGARRATERPVREGREAMSDIPASGARRPRHHHQPCPRPASPCSWSPGWSSSRPATTRPPRPRSSSCACSSSSRRCGTCWPATPAWSRSASRRSSASAPTGSSCSPTATRRTSTSSILPAALIALIASVPIALLAFRLRGGYFAIGMWVIAEVVRLLVKQYKDDPIKGGSGTSLDVPTDLYPKAERFQTTALIALGLAVARCHRDRAPAALADRAFAAGRPRRRARGRWPRRQRLPRAVHRVHDRRPLDRSCRCRLVPAEDPHPTRHGVRCRRWTAPIVVMVVIGGLGTIEGPIIGAACGTSCATT